MNKTLGRNKLIIAAVAIIVLIIGTVLVLLISWLLNGSNPFDRTRDDAVAAQINEKKNFTLDETAKIGSISFRVTNIQRNAPGSTVNSERITVTATAVLNGSRELGNVEDMRDIELNGLSPTDTKVTYTGPTKQYSATNSTTFEYTFISARTAQAINDPLVLTYKTYVNKSDSPLVGSEGAERMWLTYTISLE